LRNEKLLSKQSVEYSVFLQFFQDDIIHILNDLNGLFHSIFEDTLLMLSMGGHCSGVIVFRTVFAFVFTYLTVRFVGSMNENQFLRFFITNSYTENYLQTETLKATST
jgi:hypothetical protein